MDQSAAQKAPREGQKFFIHTFGCQMNVSDSERMAALLGEQGMEQTQEVADAHVILINGCSVREKAVHKAVSTLGRYNRLKKRRTGKKPIIGVGGCVGQLERGSLFESAPFLDFVFGPDTIDNLPELVNRTENGERHVVYADFDKSMDYSTETKVYGAKAQAFVNIMKGCDKYCTYCIVPFTRGREKSRTIDEVVMDIGRLVAQGVREVTLLGQNVNSFGKGNVNTKGRLPLELTNKIGKVGPRAGEENFPQLLRAIDSDPRCADLRRIRFTSSHPLDFSDELIECYRPASEGGVARLAAQLHLPVQSGSDLLLQRMGRHHKIADYIAQMDRLKEINPDVGISTDLIVGFPGETEEQYQETLKLLDRVKYDNLYAFAYSARPGTRAAKLEDDVSLEVKNARLNGLLEYQQGIATKLHSARIGRVMEVLVEGEAKNRHLIERAIELSGDPKAYAHAKVWRGHTSCGRVVNFMSDSPRSFIGRFVNIKMTEASGLALVGELVNPMVDGVAL